MGRRKTKKATGAFVLDAGVTVAWFFEDETSDYADSVQDALITSSALVPGIWHLEVANALLVGERRKRSTEAKATQFLTLLASLPISADEQTGARGWTDTLSLARAHALSAYDAAYLELALRHGLPLATIDEPLKAALRAVGGKLYVP